MTRWSSELHTSRPANSDVGRGKARDSCVAWSSNNKDFRGSVGCQVSNIYIFLRLELSLLSFLYRTSYQRMDKYLSTHYCVTSQLRGFTENVILQIGQGYNRFFLMLVIRSFCVRTFCNGFQQEGTPSLILPLVYLHVTIIADRMTMEQSIHDATYLSRCATRT